MLMSQYILSIYLGYTTILGYCSIPEIYVLYIPLYIYMIPFIIGILRHVPLTLSFIRKFSCYDLAAQLVRFNCYDSTVTIRFLYNLLSLSIIE